MYQKERLDCILKLVKTYGYVTVKFLSGELHYSNATINRDLNFLEKQKLIRRTYGGVEIEEGVNARLPFRYHLHKSEKLKIAKKAAEFVEDEDVIFIDASTTSEYMAEYIADKKVSVITNNMTLATQLGKISIPVVCLGGKIVEMPSMLGGEDTIENARKYKANKMFFSTGSFSESGEITDTETYRALHLVMAENSEKIYFLADEEKLKANKYLRKYLFDFGKITCVISDHEFCEETKRKFPNTKFEKI
jgi:DeoR family fructose operon transcriptional repressor